MTKEMVMKRQRKRYRHPSGQDPCVQETEGIQGGWSAARGEGDTTSRAGPHGAVRPQ